jgi:hypothetical protein
MRPIRREGGFVSLLMVAALFGFGCTETKSKSNQTSAVEAEHFYSVATKSTGFYHLSPSQEVGPDKFLPKDTVVKVIRPSFAYSWVKLMNDQEGYVASKDLRVAPPELVAAATAAARKLEPPVQTELARPTVQIPTATSTGLEPTPLPSPR